MQDFTAEAAALSPLGKAPVLKTPSGVVFESNAIARYLARARADTELLGASFVDQAQVDSWIDFSSNELELPASMWTYPVLGYMPFNLAAYTKAKEDLAKGLKTLDAYLLTRTYLVGEKITLADICVTSALVYVMKFVADKAYLKPFGNVVRYYTTCVNQPEFKAVIGEAPLCKEEVRRVTYSQSQAHLHSLSLLSNQTASNLTLLRFLTLPSDACPWRPSPEEEGRAQEGCQEGQEEGRRPAPGPQEDRAPLQDHGQGEALQIFHGCVEEGVFQRQDL